MMRTTNHNTNGSETMKATLENLIAEEQTFWDHVAREYPDEPRWIVTRKRGPCVQKGVVAGLIQEGTGTHGDVEFFRRKIDGEWSLVPSHWVDDGLI